MLNRLLTVTVLAFTLSACQPATVPGPSAPTPPVTATPNQTSPPGGEVGVSSWPVPDNRITPGAIQPGCTYPRPAYERNVTAATRRIVVAEYHYTGPVGEFDHRVPFSLCGAQDDSNIWPERYDGAPQSTYVHNYKDQLEAAIASKVRFHRMTLAQGQAVFMGDWRVAWCRYVHTAGVSCD